MADDEEVDVEEGDGYDDENVQSTVPKWQDWILRRLKSLLPAVHDSVFADFIKDYPPELEDFLQNSALSTRVMFITAIRREIKVIAPPTIIDVIPVIERTDEVKSPTRKLKSWEQKPSKKKIKKSDQKAAKKKQKESPKKIARPKPVFVPKPETTINVELAAELEEEIQAAGDDEHEVANINFQIKFNVNNWPDEKEFVYIVRQEYFTLNEHLAADSTDKDEFDQRLHVGFMQVQTGDNCRLADRIVQSIIEIPSNDRSLLMIHILALITPTSKQPSRISEDLLYNLVVRSVAATLSAKANKRPMGRDSQVSHSAQSESQAKTHADSINHLLGAEIRRYCNQLLRQQGRFETDDDVDRLYILKCQLSLFDVDFFRDSTLTVKEVEDRLSRATRQLDLMTGMSSSDAALQRWLANTIAYLCELVGRIVASRLARKAELLSAGGAMGIGEEKKEKEESRMATRMAEEMVRAAGHLHAALSSAISAEAGTSEIDRLEAATRLLIPLEEEMERVFDLIGRLDEDRRDMARERRAINQAWLSVQAIGRSIEALSLEGAIEAGNTEALRDLCRQVGDAADKLQEEIDQLQ